MPTSGLPVYNVIADYGATGNGTVDDTTAVQNAIDGAEAAGGGIVFFPEGHFRTTSTLTIDSPNVVVSGVSWGASRIQSDFHGLTLNVDATECITIENIGFDPKREKTSGAEIEIDNCL